VTSDLPGELAKVTREFAACGMWQLVAAGVSPAKPRPSQPTAYSAEAAAKAGQLPLQNDFQKKFDSCLRFY
jgi:hypothetical protein